MQYATTIKEIKGGGGGSARPVRSARSASHLEPGLFLAIFLSGIDFVVVQHYIRGLYHKLEKRQQPLVRLSGRSTSLVSGIVSLEFLAVQVWVQFCIRSSSSIVLKLTESVLLVDRCPTRMSSLSGQWGSLGSFGWAMRAFYSYYAPRISPIQVDVVGCKVSGPTVRISVDSTVSV